MGTIVAAQLASLSRADGIAEAPELCLKRVFDLFTGEALDRPAVPPFEGLSFINANGLPFQWVFTFAEEASAWGFLCEMGQPGTSIPTRRDLTLRRIDEACTLIGCGQPHVLSAIAARLTPQAGSPWPAHWHSATWVGVGMRQGMVSLKPYFNLSVGTPRERWLKAGWILRDLGREAALERLCALSTACSPGSWPAGLAVDIRPDGNAGRLKIYFRSGEVTPAWLARWYETLGLAHHAPSLRRFLDLFGMTGARLYPPSAFVISLEIHADQSFSLKTDLAVTKWAQADAAVAESTAAFLASEGIDQAPLARVLRAIGAAPPDRERCAVFRFVGLGCEPDGLRHLNLYVEPPLHMAGDAASDQAPWRTSDGRPLPQAIEQGLDALSVARHGDHWQDFALPVGASDAWVTAYVLERLSALRGALHNSWRPAWRRMIADALDWLAAAQRPSSGAWGYNGSVPEDADTTAWAVLALDGWGRPVPAGALQFLDSCLVDWRGVQGCATYPASTSPAPGWARAAPCVGAVALRALATRSEVVEGRFAHWFEADELVPAYWWASPLYTSAMLLTGFDLAPHWSPKLRHRIAAFCPAGAFERALLLDCRLQLSLPARTTARELVADQSADGRFAPSALLRLTNPEITEPWAAIDAGPLFRDENGIFTTATAVAALGRFTAVDRHRHIH